MEDALRGAAVALELHLRGEGEVVVEELSEDGEGVRQVVRVDVIGRVEFGADESRVGKEGRRVRLATDRST